MPPTAASAAKPVLELTGETTPLRLLLGDLWERRALLPMLAAKDFHSRYRSASLGVLWSVFLPILQGAVLAAVFTRIVRIQTPYSYPVFVLSGMTTWSYFTQSVGAGATSIVDGAAIAGKVYFPRLLLPAVPATANLISYGISVGVVLLLAVVFHEPFRLTLVFLPFAMVLVAALAFVVAAIAAVAHVYFRDVRYIIQAGLMVGLYATPVIYPLSQASSVKWLLVFGNPMTGAMQLVRFSLFGEADSVGIAVVASVVWLAVLLVAAVLLYRRHERIAVDRL
jgi:lipopolysaccharide transport system permease protein